MRISDWRSDVCSSDLEPHRERIRALMLKQDYAPEFIDQIFEQIKGFGSYGFPQSHAASFAKLVYSSCWLKRHGPAAVACALLNAQPMGFDSPSQIVQDARRGRGARKGIEFLPVDVAHSDWDNALVDPSPRRSALGRDRALPGTPGRAQVRSCKDQPAIRLGLRAIRGLSEGVANAITTARPQHPFRNVADLCLDRQSVVVGKDGVVRLDHRC